MKIEDIVACFLKCNDHDWMNLQLVQVKYCCFFRGGGCEGVGRAGRGWNAGNAVECGLRCCGGRRSARGGWDARVWAEETRPSVGQDTPSRQHSGTTLLLPTLAATLRVIVCNNTVCRLSSNVEMLTSDQSSLQQTFL